MKRGRNQRRRQGVNVNRALDSNGPDVRIRGTANQIYDKYQTLARDASSAGDRVKAESYLQHAEHYFRLIKSMQPANTPSQITANGEQPDVEERDDNDGSSEDNSRDLQNSRSNGRNRDGSRDNTRRQQNNNQHDDQGETTDQLEPGDDQSGDEQQAEIAAHDDEQAEPKKTVRRPRRKKAAVPRPEEEPAEAG